MSAGRMALTALLCGWLLACGERAGDPVVRVDLADAGGSAGGSGTGGSVSMPGAGGTGDELERLPTLGPTGLCGACESSEECGDPNDVCIRHDGVSFCGRDCDEGCPDGYDCVELDNSRLRQCVPTEGCPEPVTPPPGLAEVRTYLLSRINSERSERSSMPFEASACLDALAQESALEYAYTGEPLGTYVDECDPVWPNCMCNWSAQAEVHVAHFSLDWVDSIELALSNDRFAQTFLEFEGTHLGIGFWISGDEAWIALSFA